MRRIVALALLLLFPIQAQATILYVSGFESALPAGITAANGFPAEVGIYGLGASVQSSVVHAGGYALNNLANFSNLFIDTVSTSTIVCRAYVRFSATSSPGGTIFYRDSGGTVLMNMIWDGTNLELTNAGAGFSTTSGTAVITSGVWYRIDLAYDAQAGGVGKVWVDGTLDIDITHTSLQNNVARFSVSGEGSTGGYFYDDVRCDDGLTPPPAGCVIARTGLSTTPTDDVFTKSSGSTIDTVWEVPFDTTTFAQSSSTTAAEAQTMVIHDFSTTQTGRGTETLDGSETINSVSILAVAQSNSLTSGGNAGNIRRYVNGVVNDTAITIASISDRFYTTHYTDTWTNLDHYEIGWKKDASAAARQHTVKGVLLMVDFKGRQCPASVPAAIRHRVDQD